MWWYGRGYSGGSWLLEEKKAKMWPGRENSGGSWPPAFPHSSKPLNSLIVHMYRLLPCPYFSPLMYFGSCQRYLLIFVVDRAKCPLSLVGVENIPVL